MINFVLIQKHCNQVQFVKLKISCLKNSFAILRLALRRMICDIKGGGGISCGWSARKRRKWTDVAKTRMTRDMFSCWLGFPCWSKLVFTSCNKVQWDQSPPHFWPSKTSVYLFTPWWFGISANHKFLHRLVDISSLLNWALCRQACSSQIQYLSNSTKITTNTETAMLSNFVDKQCLMSDVDKVVNAASCYHYGFVHSHW